MTTNTETAPSIWTSRSLPYAYICEGGDGVWYVVPAMHGGWTKRRPYHGYRHSLTRLAPNTSRVIEADLGAGFDLMRIATDPFIAQRAV